MDVFYRRFYDTEQDIQIVDHKVQYYRNIRSAGIKLGQAVNLNKHWILNVFSGTGKCRVISFHMAYLRFNIVCAAKLQYFFSLLQGLRYRLLYKEMQAVFYGFFSVTVMKKGRSYNVQHLHLRQQFVQITVVAVAKFLFQFLAVFRIGIIKTYKVIF